MASMLKQARSMYLKRDNSSVVSLSNLEPISLTKTIPAENIFVSGSGSNKSLFECIYTSVASFAHASGRLGIEGFQPTLLSLCLPKTMQATAARISPRAWPSSSSRQSGTPPSAAQAQPPGLTAEDDSGGAEGIAAAVLRHGQRSGRAQHPTSEKVSPAF